MKSIIPSGWNKWPELILVARPPHWWAFGWELIRAWQDIWCFNAKWIHIIQMPCTIVHICCDIAVLSDDYDINSDDSHSAILLLPAPFRRCGWTVCSFFRSCKISWRRLLKRLMPQHWRRWRDEAKAIPWGILANQQRCPLVMTNIFNILWLLKMDETGHL